MSTLNEEVGALLRRADALREQDGISESMKAFWRGYAKGLRDLQSGGGQKAAAKDSATQQAAREPQAARPTLAINRESLARSKVEEVLTADSLHVTADRIADFKIDGVQKLENSKLTALVLDYEHPDLVVDVNDSSASHASSDVVDASMAQGPDAAPRDERGTTE